MSSKVLVFFASLMFLIVSAKASFASPPSLSITGAVKQPLSIPLKDLQKFESVTARLNEVTTDGVFHGVFTYRGVPLRTLLELATIEKSGSDFSKTIDLAIVVKNNGGQRAVFSWGEIFYRNPSEVLVAFSSTPVIPHRDCSGCHRPEEFAKWLEPLKRQVGFPRIVVVNDFYSDRSLENISSIEVVDIRPSIKVLKQKELFSPGFVVYENGSEKAKISEISEYLRRDVLIKQTGDGKGYHGLKTFSGTPLTDILKKAGIEPQLNAVLLISAPDGYRSLISCGELMLSPSGQNILVADTCEDQPLKKNGKFMLILSDDLSADRWVKAVDRIEIVFPDK
jgi:DMSO/TMAO reductase YedYZ molybdopterin-dependent catalytic subunit